MTDEKKKDTRLWCWNIENREAFERADDREDAIRQAVEAYADHYEGDSKDFAVSACETVQIGRLRPYAISYGGSWGSSFIDAMNQEALDDCGEVAEDWPTVTAADEENLAGAIAAVVRSWLDLTGNVPTFGTVEDIERPSLEEILAVIARPVPERRD